MTVGERRLMSAAVASLELSLRKVRGLVGGTISDISAFVVLFLGCRTVWESCRHLMKRSSIGEKGKTGRSR